METVRTRMAVRHKHYRGIADAFRSIVAKEGFPALYRVRTFAAKIRLSAECVDCIRQAYTCH